MTPAGVALPVRDPIAVPSLLLAVAFGLTSGGGALLVMAGRTIASRGDAEQAWGVPVWGTVAAAGPPLVAAQPQTARSRSGSRIGWLVLCSEIVLFAFLAAMIGAAVLDQGFARQFRHDPLAALVDGIRHLTTHIAWR
ncbi:MAG: hypothetical protein GTO03_14615 [Planctomycetales bacterium]|nr:hypothetical protein [Planctomycetales bacterium]